MQNGFIESFNGRMRDELLNETLFFDLEDARTKIANWVADYNIRRPHSSLRYLTPRGLCRPPRRNGRSAAQPRPAPPIVRCSTRATWRTKPRDSNRCWMKVRWQVSFTIGTAWGALPLYRISEHFACEGRHAESRRSGPDRAGPAAVRRSLVTKWSCRSACCRNRYRSAPAPSDPRGGLPAATYGGGHLSVVSEVFLVTT